MTAIAEVSLRMERGVSLALVGRSGAGKSTLARLIAGWEKPDAGYVAWASGVSGSCAQLIPQDPGPSLNPWLNILELVEEPLRIRKGKRDEAARMLRSCGLSEELFLRRPAALSGGEKARVAIARAVAAAPRLLILDESLSALDLITQSQILELLARLKKAMDLSMLWVLHDLDVAGMVAGEIAVMAQGSIVEQAEPMRLAKAARHPETIALLDSRPGRGVWH